MKHRLLLGIIGIAVVLLGTAAFAAWRSYSRNGALTLPAQYYDQRPVVTRGTLQLDHVVVVVMENKARDEIINNDDAPYSNGLAKNGAQSLHYYAVTHPSLPNYLALTSGTTAGITSDCNPPGTSCQANVSNIADRLEAAGKSWKAYMEDMPKPCDTTNAGNYAVKHNPFLYYPDIRDNAARCTAHDVPFTQLSSDLAGDKLPDYAFITPNLCNDMHNCSVATGDHWLSTHVPEIVHSQPFTAQHSLLVIVWDESEQSGSNNVPIIFAGPAARQRYTSSVYTSHYSLLRTIEMIWHLPPLTHNDASAPLMTDMLQNN